MKPIKSICVIDDDPVYQFIIKKSVLKINREIELIGYTDAEVALSTFKELAKTGKNLPCLILLDINLPKMDGWLFLKEYIKIKPYLTTKPDIFMASSSLVPADKEMAENHPDIKGFLLKPVDMAELLGRYGIRGE